MSIFGAAAVLAGLAAAPAHADTDIGPTAANQTVTVSLILKVRHQDALEQLVAMTSDPTSLFYRGFISVDEFVASFAPRQHEIDAITSYLAACR